MGVAIGDGRGVAVGPVVFVTVGEAGTADMEIATLVSVDLVSAVTVRSELFVGVEVYENCTGESCVAAMGVDIGVAACGVPLQRKMKKRINKRIATINLKRS